MVEYERDRLIAWAHLGKHRWRYELDDVPDGTRITETFDWSFSVFPRLIEVAGYPESHPETLSGRWTALQIFWRIMHKRKVAVLILMGRLRNEIPFFLFVSYGSGKIIRSAFKTALQVKGNLETH